MKTAVVLVLAALGSCHGHLSLLGGLLSGAHESIHKVASTVAGGLSHGLNINVESHVQSQGFNHPQQGGNSDVLVVVEETNQPGPAGPPPGYGQYGHHKPHHYHHMHHGHHHGHGYTDPNCEQPMPQYPYGNYPSQGNRPNYGNYGNQPQDGPYGDYNANNPGYGSNYGNNAIPNHGPQYGNNAGNYGNRPNPGQQYGNQGAYGNRPNQGQQGNSGSYGNQGAGQTYGPKPQYQDKPYGNAAVNTNAGSGYGMKPNQGYNGDNQGNYGMQGSNYGGSSYGKPQFDEKDEPHVSQPDTDSAGHGGYGNKPQYEDKPMNEQPAPEHAQKPVANDEHNKKPTTKKPDDDDFPLFVPLSPNDFVYDGDKVQVNEPKREASTKIPTAAENEEFPIDIRFKDE